MLLIYTLTSLPAIVFYQILLVLLITLYYFQIHFRIHLLTLSHASLSHLSVLMSLPILIVMSLILAAFKLNQVPSTLETRYKLPFKENYIENFLCRQKLFFYSFPMYLSALKVASSALGSLPRFLNRILPFLQV